MWHSESDIYKQVEDDPLSLVCHRERDVCRRTGDLLACPAVIIILSYQFVCVCVCTFLCFVGLYTEVQRDAISTVQTPKATQSPALIVVTTNHWENFNTRAHSQQRTFPSSQNCPAFSYTSLAKNQVGFTTVGPNAVNAWMCTGIHTCYVEEEDVHHTVLPYCVYRDCHGWSSIIAIHKEISVFTFSFSLNLSSKDIKVENR